MLALSVLTCQSFVWLLSAAHVRRGLRWNLLNMEMRFGGLVSTSNLIAEDEVHVETDADLVWTTQLKAPG